MTNPCESRVREKLHARFERRTEASPAGRLLRPDTCEPSEQSSGRSGGRWGGKGLDQGNSDQQNTHRTQSRSSVPSALDRVRQVAQRDRKAKFTALLHHVTIERLRDCFHRLNPKAAPGVDRVTWRDYGQNLEMNLQDLLSRVHRGAYRAKPSRRVFIPKADGRLRPLGIAALEDKLAQAAVVYEVDFLGFSYGFRPKRSQHQALDALAYGITQRKVNWVLDADIRGFFDAIDRSWMMDQTPEWLEAARESIRIRESAPREVQEHRGRLHERDATSRPSPAVRHDILDFREEYSDTPLPLKGPAC